MEQARILAVDDASDARILTEAVLGDRYTVTTVDSGSACLEAVAAQKPDLILLDIHMPGMSGFDVCQKLKAGMETAGIPVVFVSGTESLEERLRAYDEGGAEYLTKPFQMEDLLKKVEAALASQRKIRELEQRSAVAMSTAMEAMTTSGELGALMSFVRSSMGANDVQVLADKLLDTLEYFGLSGCLMITQRSGYKLFGCEDCSMEGKVLLGVNDSKTIYEFGKRTIFSRDKVRLLVKNMPYDQEARYGRLKDNLLVLCDCASSRVGSILFLQVIRQERDELMEQIIQKSETQLGSVRQKLTHQAAETQRVMSKLVSELDERLMFLGLDDDQEKSLRSLADQTHEDIHSLGAINQEIFSSVDEVMQGLYNLVQNQI